MRIDQQICIRIQVTWQKGGYSNRRKCFWTEGKRIIKTGGGWKWGVEGGGGNNEKKGLGVWWNVGESLRNVRPWGIVVVVNGVSMYLKGGRSAWKGECTLKSVQPNRGECCSDWGFIKWKGGSWLWWKKNEGVSWEAFRHRESPIAIEKKPNQNVLLSGGLGHTRLFERIECDLKGVPIWRLSSYGEGGGKDVERGGGRYFGQISGGIYLGGV